MIETAAILFGIVFLLVGILGFVPAASGIVFLLSGMAGAGASRMFFKIFGIVYALVAVARVHER